MYIRDRERKTSNLFIVKILKLIPYKSINILKTILLTFKIFQHNFKI